MGVPRYYHMCEVRQREISYDIAYMWNLNKNIIQMNLLTKSKLTHKLRERTYDYSGEGWRGGIVRESGIDMYTLL